MSLLKENEKNNKEKTSSSKIPTSVFDGILRCFHDLLIPDAIFNFDLEVASTKLKEEAVQKKIKIGGAESITGGLISGFLTSVPGSSDYFQGSVVTYSARSKVDILCIDEDLLNFKGIVSEWTAREMALSARRLFRSHIGYGVTGYAGPKRGDEEKEVGTVCFGFSLREKSYTWQQVFSGDRNDVRKQAAAFVILGLYLLALNSNENG